MRSIFQRTPRTASTHLEENTLDVEINAWREEDLPEFYSSCDTTIWRETLDLLVVLDGWPKSSVQSRRRVCHDANLSEIERSTTAKRLDPVRSTSIWLVQRHWQVIWLACRCVEQLAFPLCARVMPRIGEKERERYALEPFLSSRLSVWWYICLMDRVSSKGVTFRRLEEIFQVFSRED